MTTVVIVDDHPVVRTGLHTVLDGADDIRVVATGADGYLLKDEAPETLVKAVRAVARGKSWLSPTVASQVVDRATHRTPTPEPRPAVLTPREPEVLRLLAQGLDNAAIAQALVVTKRTVQNHVSTIYGKLGVDSRTQAALYAIRRGLVAVGSEPPDVG